MSINLELYRVFVHVVKAGSISKAADSLYITQPAVSQAIKQLEEKLGGQLLFRTPKGIRPTREGEVVFQYAEQAYNFILTAENKFREMQNLMSGQIKISASDTLCMHYLAPYLGKFRSSYPKVHIQVTNRTTMETIELLKRGMADLGIINLPIDDDNQLLIREVLQVRDCFVSGERYKKAADYKISLKELTEYPLLLLEKTSNTRRSIDDFSKAHGITLEPEIELGSIDLLVQFAKTGLGIACVIRDFVTNEIENGELYEIKLTEEMPPRKIGIVTLKNVPVSAAVKRFSELLNYN